jgi:hypothetical protein
LRLWELLFRNWERALSSRSEKCGMHVNDFARSSKCRHQQWDAAYSPFGFKILRRARHLLCMTPPLSCFVYDATTTAALAAAIREQQKTRGRVSRSHGFATGSLLLPAA